MGLCKSGKGGKHWVSSPPPCSTQQQKSARSACDGADYRSPIQTDLLTVSHCMPQKVNAQYCDGMMSMNYEGALTVI